MQLTAGDATTASGRAFIFDRLNVREATAAEIDRAEIAATPGIVNSWPASTFGTTLAYPVNVNEYGFSPGGSVYIVPGP